MSEAIFGFTWDEHDANQGQRAAEFGGLGPRGNTGETGATGATGPGVPSGGTTGQVLAKASGTSFDTAWTTISAGVTSWLGRTGAIVAASTDFNALLDAAGADQKVRRIDANTLGFGAAGSQGKIRELAGGYVRILNWDETGYVEISPSGGVSLVSSGSTFAFDTYAIKLNQSIAYITRDSTALDGTTQSPLATTTLGWHDLTASSPTTLRGFGWNTYAGSIKYIANDGPSDVTCNHEDTALGTTSQRWKCPGAANLTLPAGSLALVQYDGSRQRIWRMA